jgi:hypothetical protein
MGGAKHGLFECRNDAVVVEHAVEFARRWPKHLPVAFRKLSIIFVGIDS